MKEGTGPGRGVPWWRFPGPATLTHKPGEKGPEKPGQPREGETVKKFGKDR